MSLVKEAVLQKGRLESVLGRVSGGLYAGHEKGRARARKRNWHRERRRGGEERGRGTYHFKVKASTMHPPSHRLLVITSS